MTPVVPAHIAHAVAKCQEPARLRFMEMSDEEKAEVVAKVNAVLEERLLEGSGDGCTGLLGKELR